MSVVLGSLISKVPQTRCGDGSYPVLSMTMHDGIVFQQDRFSKVIASRDTTNYKVVKRGQLVVGFPINEGVIYPQTIVDVGIMSPAYSVWDIDQSSVDIGYLNYCLHSPASMKYYADKLRGSTARRKSLPTPQLLALPIYLPPLDIQRRIAAVLDKAKSLIAARREQIAVLDKLSKDLFIDMFGDPLQNPYNFEVVKMGTLGTFKNGMNYAQNESGFKIKCLGVGDFGALFNINAAILSAISLAGKPSDGYMLQNGDIVFVRSNGSKELVGRSVMIENVENDDVTFSGFCIRLRITDDSIHPLYLNSLLHLEESRNALFRTTRGANIQNLNQQMLSALDIMKPSIEKQQEFAGKITAINQQKARLNASLTELENIYKSLTQRAFTGELFA